MGDTPRELLPGGLVRRVSATFGGELTHAPADPRALYRASDEHYYISLGRRPPQSGFPDGAGWKGELR